MAVTDLKNKARDMFRRKQYQMAIEAYTEYLRFQPDDEEAAQGFFKAAMKAQETRGKRVFGGMLSKMSIGGKDPKKRMAACFRALGKNPTDKGVLRSLGEAATQANAYGAAVAAYSQAVEVAPEDAEAWKRLGEALGRRGKIKEALDALRKSCELNPRDQEANKLRKNLAAEGALKLSGYETAKSSRDLIKDKDQAQELESETRMQLTSDHAASEIERVQAQIAEDPSNSRLMVRLADLQEQSGDHAAGFATLEKAYGIDPANYELSVRIGDRKLAKLKRAFTDAAGALKAAPDDASKQAAREAAYKAMISGSLDEYTRRVKEHPLDLAVRFELGTWLLRAGDVDKALAEFQQTVRDPNRKIQSLRLQAKCFEQKNLIGLAVKKLEEAITGFPTLVSDTSKAISYEYADLLERKGDTEEAKAVFERIVEADASYKDALDRLSKLAG